MQLAENQRFAGDSGKTSRDQFQARLRAVWLLIRKSLIFFYLRNEMRGIKK
jgi:hypothetical protein